LRLEPGGSAGYETWADPPSRSHDWDTRDRRFLHRTVAIKVLPEALALDPQFRDRFDREARAISALDHPHICALYDVGEQDGTSFVITDWPSLLKKH
jgi:serine/threonine protein kinase